MKGQSLAQKVPLLEQAGLSDEVDTRLPQGALTIRPVVRSLAVRRRLRLQCCQRVCWILQRHPIRWRGVAVGSEASVSRGDVFLVVLSPTRGQVIQKTSPCVVVSPDELNAPMRTFIVAPLTT